MSTVALQEACQCFDALMDAEFRGRKDTESAARFRLAKAIGVPESYLFRLAHKRREMRDVGGEVYRRIKLAYEAICEANEKAADAMRAERLQLKADRHATTNKEPASAGVGGPSPRNREDEETLR